MSPLWIAYSCTSLRLLTPFPWILLAPGVFLALLLVSLNVLGDGLRDAFDVRLRRR